MIEFNAAPPVPLTYLRLLAALTRAEITEAMRLGYVAADVDPSSPVHHNNAFNVYSPIATGLEDWRNRMFLIWFCYLFENFFVLQKPLAAIEEIILELEGGPIAFDAEMPRLASLYAGAAAREPLSRADLEREQAFLTPYYQNAVKQLNTW